MPLLKLTDGVVLTKGEYSQVQGMSGTAYPTTSKEPIEVERGYLVRLIVQLRSDRDAAIEARRVLLTQVANLQRNCKIIHLLSAEVSG